MYDISGAAPVHVRRRSDICRTTIGPSSDHPRTTTGPSPEREAWEGVGGRGVDEKKRVVCIFFVFLQRILWDEV